MFTEKNIELAKKLRSDQKVHIETFGNRDSRGTIVNELSVMDNFKLLKLAQLENKIEELRGGK